MRRCLYSRRNTPFVYVSIHFCFFRQITLKEGVTKQKEIYEDEWPKGRLRGLRWNPMTRETEIECSQQSEGKK